MLSNISRSWLNFIDIQALSIIERKIAEITPEAKLCPPKNLWFEWARLTPLEEIKVIVIGQDPYATKDMANGLAFSTRNKKIPGSLRNIFAAARLNTKDGDLSGWAKQGVLLLNSALSTEENHPNKHARIWTEYTQNLINEISKYGKAQNKKYTYLLWGNYAQKMKPVIDSEWHYILEWVHPSPLAQTRLSKEKRFINCPHFAICHQRHNIDWGSPPNRCIKVFTDGSCMNNGQPNARAAFAAIFVEGPLAGLQLFGKIKIPTNNRAEGKAIYYVLKHLKTIPPDAWDAAEIYTDSLFWIDMINKYIPNWNEAKFAKQANSDLTKKIWNVWNSFPAHKLNLIHVRAHQISGKTAYENWCIQNNNAADSLAKKTCGF